MTNINTYLIVGGIVVLTFLSLGFWGGYKAYHHWHPCPAITHDTTIVHDTVTHTITKDHYIVSTDTVIHTDTILKDIDTVAILHDYYDKHVYNRHWADTNVAVNIIDTISMNRSIGNIFTYKLLRPQTVIVNTTDNSITYNKYVYAGLSVPISTKYINEISLDALYAFPKGYIGASWQFLNKNVLSAKAGLTIFKYKTKK